MPGQQDLWITTNFSRFTAPKMVVAKIMPAVTTLKARARMKVTAADVVVEKDLGQIKARELLCQASEARAAE